MSSPKRAHAPRVPFALLVTALIVGGLCALLALNTASAANELSRHDLASKDADISDQVQQLRNDVAASAAPQALASAAAALGMVPAGAPAFLKELPDGRVVVMGSPAAASAAVVAPPPATPAHPTPTPTPTPTKTKTAKTKTAKPGSSSTPKPSTSPRPTTTPTPTSTPTSTPTPTTTIGGGPR